MWSAPQAFHTNLRLYLSARFTSILGVAETSSWCALPGRMRKASAAPGAWRFGLLQAWAAPCPPRAAARRSAWCWAWGNWSSGWQKPGRMNLTPRIRQPFAAGGGIERESARPLLLPLSVMAAGRPVAGRLGRQWLAWQAVGWCGIRARGTANQHSSFQKRPGPHSRGPTASAPLERKPSVTVSFVRTACLAVSPSPQGGLTWW